MIGQYFIQVIFSDAFQAHGNEHYAEEFMPSDLFSYLEGEAKKKFGNTLNLHEAHNEWDLDRFFITVGGAIEDIGSDQEEFVTINFHVGKGGKISNITMDGDE